MLLIAVPRYADEIAPLFDAATRISLYRVENDQPVLAEVIVIESDQGLDRVRKLQEAGISILICNGISSIAKNILQTRGVTVINRVTGLVDNALKAFYTGKLCGSDGDPIFQHAKLSSHLDDLLQQTKDLFLKHGYSVCLGKDQASFPVDLVAQITCPVCSKTVRVAICCGMHTHRMDDEIRAYHQTAGGVFDALVYTHFTATEVDKTCADFGIQALNPSRERRCGKVIPLLKGPVAGHDDCLKTR
jgi:predicted Fe-Mo cluster-binding NifX family protein